jgi:hypothetical protein
VPVVEQCFSSKLHVTICTIFQEEYPYLPVSYKSGILQLVTCFNETGSTFGKRELDTCNLQQKKKVLIDIKGLK